MVKSTTKTTSTRKLQIKAAKLRSTITPGTVLILLAGPYRGKRVVFLKQLDSGLLLVTGPFRLNGVPLRRANQAYVIATSTKIDISKVNTDKFTDEYFAKSKADKRSGKKTEEEFFALEKESQLSAQFIADQKEMDKSLMTVIAKDKMMPRYLRCRFTLSNGMYPHEMKF
ncbi:60S ribosomal protein L6 [Perkinsus olseni]|uniref:60S ribosomal protein L6 n=2 Tax=Perkinsus olseni TaxID=32597 RepID=A0A7J6NLH3_PEROL|nr:60S ribosomal protein L6 [Perkinsus olseni]KAF4684742.1 60S ribosomal protein L6 [Perkinsus olseni]